MQDEQTSEAVSEAENAEGLAAFDERADEPDLPFDAVVRELRRDGLI